MQVKDGLITDKNLIQLSKKKELHSFDQNEFRTHECQFTAVGVSNEGMAAFIWHSLKGSGP